MTQLRQTRVEQKSDDILPSLSLEKVPILQRGAKVELIKVEIKPDKTSGVKANKKKFGILYRSIGIDKVVTFKNKWDKEYPVSTPIENITFEGNKVFLHTQTSLYEIKQG